MDLHQLPVAPAGVTSYYVDLSGYAAGAGYQRYYQPMDVATDGVAGIFEMQLMVYVFADVAVPIVGDEPPPADVFPNGATRLRFTAQGLPTSPGGADVVPGPQQEQGFYLIGFAQSHQLFQAMDDANIGLVSYNTAVYGAIDQVGVSGEVGPLAPPTPTPDNPGGPGGDVPPLPGVDPFSPVPVPDPVITDPVPTPDPVPVPDPVTTDPTPDVDPTPDPAPVDPTPDPAPDPAPADPVPDPAPVDPTPDPAPVDPAPAPSPSPLDPPTA